MENKKYIWIIIVIAVIVGISFLVMGGVFENKNEVAPNASLSANKKTVEKSEENYRQEIKQMDLTEENLDFEFDDEEMKEDMDNVSVFDEATDVSGLDAEVY